MLDFDFLCGRPTPSVAAVVTAGAPRGSFQKFFFGREEIAVPQFGSTSEACAAHPRADVFINFAVRGCGGGGEGGRLLGVRSGGCARGAAFGRESAGGCSWAAECY